MLVSNKKITRFHYFIFVLWLVTTLMAAIYFISKRLVPFDPNGQLTDKSSTVIMADLSEINALKGISLNNKIVHFTSSNCTCSEYSKAHKQSINELAKKDGFNVLNVHLSSDTSTLLPSTPSILIVNEIGKLIYLGPYSAGLACSETNGYVEIVLKNNAKGYSSSLIVNDLEGCYCSL